MTNTLNCVAQLRKSTLKPGLKNGINLLARGELEDDSDKLRNLYIESIFFSPSVFSKHLDRWYNLAPKGKGISMGAPGMTEGMQGGNRLYAGSFWHQVRKKPELWVDKSKKIQKLLNCAKRLRSVTITLVKQSAKSMTGINDEYRQHPIFAQLARYREFYKDLGDLVFDQTTQGTQSFFNIDTYVYSSMNGTLESIHQVLYNGRINDAYALLRKFYDSTVINIYTNLYLEDHFSIENFIVEKIDGWLKGKEKMPGFKTMSEYILSSPKLDGITIMLFDSKQYVGSTLATIRERCNSHTHYLYFHNVLSNNNEIHLPERLTYLNDFLKDLEAIFIMHLAYLFYLKDEYMRSPDYVDSIEFGLTPEEGSEYYVSPFIQDLFDEVIKANRPDLAAAIKKKTMMQLN